MKKLITAALAAAAIAALLPTPAFADDPVSPAPGALCNLYPDQNGNYESVANSISEKTAVLTFIDAESNFKSRDRKQGIWTCWGLWTGWMKVDRAGKYTFLCDPYDKYGNYSYTIWINGQKCVQTYEQRVFDVELNAGFNSVRVVVYNGSLRTSFKRAGSLKEYVPFGPQDMFYDKDAVEED